MSHEATIDVMRATAQALRTGDTRAKIIALQQMQDAADAAKSVLLAELKDSGDHELDGASSINTWVRNKLRLNAGQATALMKNLAALEDLPLVGESATAGRISAAHVRVFVYGLANIALEHLLLHQEVLVTLAEDRDPAALFETIKHLQGKFHPEDLDDNHERGADRQDFNVDPTFEGWHVSGFLNTTTGAKVKKMLDALAAPDGEDDTRTGPERRVQALDDLASSFLDSGLPSDKGIRPHLSVHVNADTLEAAATHEKQQTEHPLRRPDPMPPTEPATLAGHGNIGPGLLMYLFCVSSITGILFEQSTLLNVGRTRRNPSLKQRQGVLARQKGVCATPGCNHTHLEIHHVIWWSLGGPTDIDKLIGLCSRCHHLVHRHRLRITGDATDGFEFTTATGRPLRRRRRTSRRPAA